MMKKALNAVLPILGSSLLATALWSQAQPIPQGFQNGQAARLALGQTNFSDISFGTTQDRLGAISGMALAGNKLIVADSSYLAPPNNNRILIYNDFAAFKNWEGGHLIPADVVVGQPDFSSAATGTTASRMNQPVGVASDGTRLFVADWGNNRVLIFNRIPETSGATADVVIGQDRFDSSDFGAGPQKLRRPNSVSTDGTRLFITDTLNNRVLIYNRIPTQNGAPADVVLGQPNFEGSRALPPAADTLSSPMSATTDGQRLIISDLGNNRILIYNRVPTQSGAAADVVVGQPDFASNGAGNTPTSTNFPRFAYSDGQRLLAVDSGNNRILIYNRIPTANGTQPDVVLGQADFMGLLESCAASNFAVPYAAAGEGGMLFVSDSFNRRILGFQPGPELITLNGILNAASFSTEPQTQACGVVLPQPPLAPGAIASVFGTSFAEATVAADSTPLPTELGGVRVKFNGIPAPLFFVSRTQINVQIPFELPGYSASVQVEKTTPQGTIVSAAAPVALSTGAPGVFTVSGDGQGPGVIVHADFSPVTAESPALPGEPLIAYATGLGTVDHPVTNGVPIEFAASGSVTVGGTIGAGQTLTILINEREHSYTTAATDTLDSIATSLAEIISANDPEVSATANTTDFQVKLSARVQGDQGTGISYNAFVSEGATLTLDTGLGNTVPRNVVIGGTPEPGQTVTITLADVASSSYTMQPGDTLETIVNNLAELVNGDPNVTAIADPANSRILLQLRDPGQTSPITISLSVSEGATLTIGFEPPHLAPGSAKATNTVTANVGATNAAVSFAGLVRGTVGLYQVDFSVPSDAKPDPAAILTLYQNLIVFGSVTGTNIFSNPVTFPIGP
ncbi:MAG: hypothetical protein A3H28_10815 [Acidobacteria bacterium RIFCSPLOWO2_02_FULL_61_28]|nr:MAG: hypothetical protein A3H28_10815 [Acidobacteria bacterium RIFCSPLOWO2_02_FULL_61_28]